MSINYRHLRYCRSLILIGSAILVANAPRCWSIQPAVKLAHPDAESQSSDETQVVAGGESRPDDVVIKSIDLSDQDDRPSRKEVAWLGVAADEASEVLAAQLGLEHGVGLVITYVATNSPAAKAGLSRNDVLVQLDDQALVHPAQLRKLVRMHNEGDQLKLAYYRAGKRETTTATLAKTSARLGMTDDEGNWHEDLRQLGRDLKELPIKEAIHEQMRALRESLGNIKVDQKKVQAEVRRSMDEARKAIQEAMRSMSNVDLGPVRKALEELAHSGVTLDNDATVTVRSTAKAATSIVQTDDSGSIVLITRPKLHLTAHDKEGKLLFDGEIQTAEQRAKVPGDVWNRVEPLLKKLDETPAEEPEAKDSQ